MKKMADSKSSSFALWTVSVLVVLALWEFFEVETMFSPAVPVSSMKPRKAGGEDGNDEMTGFMQNLTLKNKIATMQSL